MFNVPRSVEIIEFGCFLDCEGLRFLIFSSRSQLLRVEASACAGCSSLGALGLPASLRVIGRGCLCRCGALSQVRFSSAAQLRELMELDPELPDLAEVPAPAVIRQFGENALVLHHWIEGASIRRDAVSPNVTGSPSPLNGLSPDLAGGAGETTPDCQLVE
jgi:hypothetical protein